MNRNIDFIRCYWKDKKMELDPFDCSDIRWVWDRSVTTFVQLKKRWNSPFDVSSRHQIFFHMIDFFVGKIELTLENNYSIHQVDAFILILIVLFFIIFGEYQKNLSMLKRLLWWERNEEFQFRIDFRSDPVEGFKKVNKEIILWIFWRHYHNFDL